MDCKMGLTYFKIFLQKQLLIQTIDTIKNKSLYIVDEKEMAKTKTSFPSNHVTSVLAYRGTYFTRLLTSYIIRFSGVFLSCKVSDQCTAPGITS